MKHFIDKSKQKILEKLKWFSSILDVIANIFKSFAMIISSLVAATTAGVTGYYEVKKIVKKERHIVKATSGHGPAMSGEGSGSGVATQPSGSLEVEGYRFDINSGAFLVSIILLGILVFKKIKGAAK